MAVKPGYFKAQEVQDVEGQAWLGGEISRPAQVAAILNSTRIASREYLPDVFDGQTFATLRATPQSNKAERFQYVTLDSYKGFVPWEVQPQMPDDRPWE